MSTLRVHRHGLFHTAAFLCGVTVFFKALLSEITIGDHLWPYLSHMTIVGYYV